LGGARSGGAITARQALTVKREFAPTPRNFFDRIVSGSLAKIVSISLEFCRSRFRLATFGASAAEQGDAAPQESARRQGRKQPMTAITLNGATTEVDAPDAMPLLWAIRDLAGLPGTKYGCGVGLCGACTVHVDGVAARSCQMTVGDAKGKAITTIEGLSATGDHRVQVAWRELNVPQCGFCQTGQIMQAASLLTEKPDPTDAEILAAMAGNVCRCGCYQRIVAAVRLASTGA
jgi:isoquinoline 1-oxidoreductase alpha subunit